MTQDLKDLKDLKGICLISKELLHTLFCGYDYTLNTSDKREYSQALAQDLSGMRLVPESLLTPNQLAWVNAYAPA